MNYRYFVQKFWYIVWFVALPLSISWVAVDILDRWRIVDEFEPWYVLLLFAILVIFIYSSRNKLPFWRDKNFDSEFNRKKRTKIANVLIKRIKKILKKHSHKVKEKNLNELKELIHSLKQNIEKRQHDEINRNTKKLESIANKHLAFAQKKRRTRIF